jgi:predicted RecA/RadA family phage recombinase
MRTFIQPGRTITVPAPRILKSGEACRIGALFGVANGDAVNGELVDLDLEGVFDLPKVAAQAVAVGDELYFDEATKLLTKTQPVGAARAGVAVAVAGNPSASVAVRIG